jgi:hypothetical protein
MSYYIMSTQYSAAFNNPAIAIYDNGKLALSGVAPEGFEGEVKDLTNMVNEDGEPWTNEQFVPLIDKMRAETPTGALVIISEGLGQYLYANHPAFKPVTEELT